MSVDPRLDSSLAEAAERVRAGELTATDLVDASLARIDQTDGDVGAFASVQADAARARAAELDRADPVGPLHGVPVALKDLIFTTGVPAEANSEALAGFTPEYDATVVHRLHEAGAIVIGKTNTHELAFGVSCPASKNPWDLTRMTGGSSGGSAAALAARQVFGALGSDTGGSVRIPSNYCGTSAIKTTRGLVPRRGVHLISWTYDTIGPMARTAEDCRLLLEVLAGPSADDPYSSPTPLTEATPPSDLRLGVPTDAWLGAAPMNDEVAAVMFSAADALRDIVSNVAEVSLPAWEEHAERGSIVVFAEAATINADLRSRHGDRLGAEVRGILDAGAALSAVDLASAQDMRHRFEQEWLAVFGDVDLVLCPVTPNQVPPHGTEELYGLPLIPATTHFTFAVNGAGLPAISLPGGFAADGLPIGFQLIGRPHSELTLAAVGEAFQAATNYHLRSPHVAH